jgi:hypothetical protein
MPLWLGQAQCYLFVMNCCSVGLQLLQVFQIPTTWKLLGNQRSIHSTLGIIRCLRNKLYGHQEVCAILYDHVTVLRDKFLFNKTNRRTNFPNLFCQETLHVSSSSSVHHQEFSTVHSALVYEYVTQVGRAWKLSSNLHDIDQCRMYSGKLLMMDRGTARNM